MPIGARRKRPCHAKERVEAKVRRERFWHRLLSGVDIVSSCERCCGSEASSSSSSSFFPFLRMLKFVYISGACGVSSVSGRAIFTPPESELLRVAVSAPGQAVAETMVAA